MLQNRLFDHKLTTPIVNAVFNITFNERLTPEIMAEVASFYYWLEAYACNTARIEKSYPTKILLELQNDLKNKVAETRSLLYRTFRHFQSGK